MRDRAGLTARDAAAVVAAASLLALLLSALPPLRSMGLTLDNLLLILLAPVAAQDRHVTVVTIDEDSLAGGACRSPIDRALLAGLVERVDAMGARAIGLDVLLDQPTTAEADARLGAALRRARAPVVAITAEPGTAMTERQRAWHAAYLEGIDTGFANLVKDRTDGVVRRHRTAGTGDLPSFPAALAAAAGTGRPPAASSDSGGLDEIAWHGRPAPDVPSFPIYPAETLGQLPAAWLAERVVLIGSALDGVDRHRTPFSLLGPDMPGIEIHAHVVAQLLEGRRAARPPAWLAPELLATLGAVAGLAAAAAWPGLAAQLGLALLAPLAITGAAGATYALGGPLAPVLPPALAWLTAQVLATGQLAAREHADRRLLMRLFAYHVSAPIAREVWKARHTFLVGGRPRPQTLTATVLFSDVEGSTGVAEVLGPEATLGWLEAYLDLMVGVVDRHGGVVLRFVGDGLLAAFGVPVPRAGEAEVAGDARRAVACALAMGEALDGLNAEFAGRGLPPIRIRVGIQTGQMTAGSLGRAEHLEYALLGDAVNTAARLEVFAKTLRGPDSPACTVVIGEATRARLGPEVRARLVGEVRLSGKKALVGVFEVAASDVVGDAIARPAR